MRWFHIFWTIALFALFVAIVVWAWSGRRKQSFDEAAGIPLQDDKSIGSSDRLTENGDG